MPLTYPIVTRTLDNGLRVVVSEDRSVPAVTVNLWVDVGSRHEVPGQTGLAHLFEHLMFQGSENVAEGEHFAALMAHGGRLNATTWFDRTNYFETVPTGALDLALWLEADRHGRLRSALTQENLDNQRDVVKEEKRQRYDNQPYGNAVNDLVGLVFPQGHPYHHPTIGSMEDLDAASLETVHAFYDRHYGPDTTVLTLVGDVAAQEGFAAAERYFGDLPRTNRSPQPRSAPLGPLPAPQRVVRVQEVPNDRIYLGFRFPQGHTAEYLAGAVALDALGGLAISRLHRRLVRRDDVATGVSASSMGLVDGTSLAFIAVDVSEGRDIAEAEETLLEELLEFARTGPTELELEASLADTERSWLEALAGMDERADLIGHSTCLYDDPHFVNTFLDEVATVTAEEVQLAAQRWLQPEHRAAVIYRDGDPVDQDVPLGDLTAGESGPHTEGVA
ncbi:M16 family metallopeptidase [Ornithinicoccus hortensis]|uniref:Putative Zn-dependent peptidase n=1 Tax=Ornithinicoccus hortensis TaxID=82346 RepID=A0A542YQI7_9MICO|nr:pitrilysin family protein [Ornithinicoccus hortensis]TQL50184.1 putative Zn-dependent peptidase [Ornithinicoccus hortensis]